MSSSEQALAGRIACPFVYARGETCPGHIVRIEAYKADIAWERDGAGQWRFGFGPRSHYHLFCSEKGNHAGFKRQDDPQMKFHWRELPDEIRKVLESTDPQLSADLTIAAPRAGG
ncbi:hypothetical protein [Caulobacter sp. NIBR1757]|uniref:hypothetical protein n=1 Tax=Caulobacter sp. NIBR1757 TaxID=3016000 RepID=UPI0022F05FDD|nr:hypothetical protein [Caulobacter sp. NIBR1757]WGM40354.1 hypothetical protein AMEJIAPC_03299 [Caulobacter sp. NIBR1757]